MHFVRVLITAMQQKNINYYPILKDAQINEEHIVVKEARITPAQLAAVFQGVWQATDDELMGFGAEPIRRGVFLLATKYAIQADTLGEALYRMGKFYRAVTGAFSLSIETTGHSLTLDVILNDSTHNTEPLPKEFLMLLLHRISSWMIGQFIPLISARFDYPRPDHEREYQLMFACQCEFKQATNRLELPLWVIDKPLVQNKTSLIDYVNKTPEEWFKRQHYHQHIASQVVKALDSAKQLRNTQITDIAQQLNVTDRTLRRRLTREGTSFQALKDEFRRDKAIDMLSKTKLTVAEIANELGFTEPNAFTRAFKQWTGSTPKSYRP